MAWQGSSIYEQRQFEHRISVIFTGIIVLACVLSLRLFYLQVIRGKQYLKISESNRTQVFFQQAPRGVIYDCNREVLVDHRPSFVVLFSPLEIPEAIFNQVVKTLAPILQVSTETLIALIGDIKKRSAVIRLAQEISRNALFRILEKRPRLPGVTIAIEPMRRYPFGDWGSHLFGYLGEISPQELRLYMQDGYKAGDIIGKSGLEKVYDYYLRGKAGGMQLEVDASGRSQRILYQIPSIPGNELLLTINQRVQQAAEDAFKKNSFTGAAVAIDPRNGKVRALVSSPNFDPNLFLKPLDKEASQTLFSEVSKRMYNRALQGLYSPGSVFKIITMCAALETNTPFLKQTITCRGKYRLGRQEFKCWEKDGHGQVDLMKAVAVSCNVYFYQLGLAVGMDALSRYARLFGLGSMTGIDLPEEKQGLMPDPAWKKRKYREIWYDGETVNASIGQGFILVTPLQLANMIAAVGNRGKLFKPYILEQIIGAKEEVLWEGKKELIRQIRLDAQTWEILDKGLKNAVVEGTGRASYIPGLEIGGKTGTVQNPQGDDHAWFVAYASLPQEEPRIAVAVLVEHGKHGASTAAPIARAMINAAFPELSSVSK